MPWFALFEWSKQRQGADAVRRPALLIALVLAIAALSIALEYLVNFCVGDVTDHLGLLVMRRLPAIGVDDPADRARPQGDAPPAARSRRRFALSEIAGAIDWVAAADNYVELHSQRPGPAAADDDGSGRWRALAATASSGSTAAT